FLNVDPELNIHKKEEGRRELSRTVLYDLTHICQLDRWQLLVFWRKEIRNHRILDELHYGPDLRLRVFIAHVSERPGETSGRSSRTLLKSEHEGHVHLVEAAA